MQTARKRTYVSPARRAQAEGTQNSILDAARTLFRASGYGGTSIERIARKAGVAPQTIYATFGSKRAILRGLVARAKRESDVGGRYAAMMAKANPSEQLRLITALTSAFCRNAWDVVDLLRASGDYGRDELRAMEDQRLDGTRAFVRQLGDRGHLRSGLGVERGADIVWALNATDNYRSLVIERGWSDTAFEEWLSASMERELL